MMNPTLEQLLTRRSIRAFTDEPVVDSDLEMILRAGQQAPSSINGQQVSLVVTRDPLMIARIAEIAGGQPQVRHAKVFITIVMDFYRTEVATQLAGEQQKIQQSLESLLVGAVDAGIMLNTLQTAANSLGYGCTAIGGIRRDPQAMIDLLGLPMHTFPLCGLTVGVPDGERLPQVKPRVSFESFAMHERYQVEQVAQGVKAYDVQLRDWWDQQGLQKMPSYNQAVASFYKNGSFESISQVLNSQGFLGK